MQPLSSVKPDCRVTNWGSNSVMLRRPAVAVKIAQYIAEWAEIESFLGLFLALLLHANQKAVLAIYNGLENRAAQLRMLTSAAHAVLKDDHLDVFSVLMKIDIKPMMKFRDKLAHWNWGYSEELPDALILREPADKLANLSDFVEFQRLGHHRISRDLPINFDRLYVLKEPDLDRSLKQMSAAQNRFLEMLATIWERNSQEVRAQYLNKLKDMPPIRSELDRLAASRNNPKVPPQPLG